MVVEAQAQVRPLGQGALAALRLVSSALRAALGGQAHAEVVAAALSWVSAQMAERAVVNAR